MNVPHDKICPDCGAYMEWNKDHYKCFVCDHIGRKMWRWQKVVTISTVCVLVFVIFHQFIMT